MAWPWRGPHEMPAYGLQWGRAQRVLLGRRPGGTFREGGILTFGGDSPIRSHLEAGPRGSKEGRERRRGLRAG